MRGRQRAQGGGRGEEERAFILKAELPPAESFTPPPLRSSEDRANGREPPGTAAEETSARYRRYPPRSPVVVPGRTAAESGRRRSFVMSFDSSRH